MIGRIAVALSMLVAGATMAAGMYPDLAAPAAAGPPFETLPMALMAERFAGEFPLEPQPEGLDPVAANQYWLHERNVLGRTPMGWVDWTHATYDLVVEDVPPADPEADPVAGVLRIYAALGLPVTIGDRLAIGLAAAQMPHDLRAPFGELVAVIADVYEGQVPIVADLATRWPQGFDMHEPFLAVDQREASAARAATIVDALALFRARTAHLWPELASTGGPVDAPLFTDPEGLVILGGLGDDTYTQGGAFPDPVLVVEPMGNDLYLNSAGGADPLGILSSGTGGGAANKLVLSVVVDLLGDDTYSHVGAPRVVQGAGAIGGIGILVDATGDDSYLATMTRTNAGPFSPMYLDGGGQGYGFAGYGLLLDPIGDDLYNFDVRSTMGRSIFAFAQGFGAAGGLGISSDGAGNDRWLSHGLGITGCCGGSSFQGIYVMGTGFYAGVGIMTDTGLGHDVYHGWLNSTTVDYYAQGFGAFGGLGILYEDGGDDRYVAVERATNSWLTTVLNCAYGTASLGGVGVFIEVSGNDRYFGDTIVAPPKKAATMNEGFGGIGAGYGLFVDFQGADEHIMQAHGAIFGSFTAGRGVAFTGGNIIGNYLDAGGVDFYEGPGEDDGVWVAGADTNVIP